MSACFSSLFGFRQRQRFARARKGTTAVEMALIAPIFFLFLIGTVEISLVMLAQHLMENAAYNTSRLASTGFSASGQSQQQTISALLNTELQSLGTLIDINQVTMTSTAYGSMAGIGVAGQGTGGTGTGAQVVVYTISY
ncbi:MAG: TadE/TadG family type IV pilus assembly protein, partial [Bdellovibrionales bacterium]